MVRALHAGLGFLLDEGLEAAWSRHAHCGALLAEGLGELGLEFVVEPGHRSAAAHYGLGAGGDSGWEGRGPGARPSC